MKIRVDRCMFRVIMIFPITTLLQTYFELINKVVFAVLLILVLYNYKQMERKNVLLLGITLASYVITIVMTGGKPNNINELFYFPFMILYFLMANSNKHKFIDYIIEDKFFILNIVRIWTILIVFSFFLPSSYSENWGGEIYFSSYCEDIFRLAPTCVFVMTLAVCFMLIYDSKQYIIYSFIPLISLYMGGSRTYLGVGILIFLLAWYYFLNSKIKFAMFLLPLSVILVYFVLNSSVGDKINATMYTSKSYFDYWGTITNGRSIFWAADLKAFADANFFKKMFGHGLNYVYTINDNAVGGEIWAHNDFIQCLISHGLIGLVLYLYAIISLLKEMKIKESGFLPIIVTIFVWCINAFFNMFYTYFCSLLSFPFLLITVIWSKKIKTSNEEDN